MTPEQLQETLRPTQPMSTIDWQTARQKVSQQVRRQRVRKFGALIGSVAMLAGIAVTANSVMVGKRHDTQVLTSRPPVPNLSPPVHPDGKAVMIDGIRNFAFRYQASQLPVIQTGVVDIANNRYAISATGLSGPVVADGNLVYYQGNPLNPDQPWHVRARQSSDTFPLAGNDILGITGPANTREFLSAFTVGGFRAKGQLVIDGVLTTDYQASIDLAKLGPYIIGANAVTFDVWVGPDGLTRRVERNVTVDQQHQGNGGAGSYFLDFSALNSTSPAISIPPANQISPGATK